MAVGGLLLVVIAVALARLALRQRRGKFGTRLLTKLAGIFALVGLLTGKRRLEDAREELADRLGCDSPERVVFTSGATESLGRTDSAISI